MRCALLAQGIQAGPPSNISLADASAMTLVAAAIEWHNTRRQDEGENEEYPTLRLAARPLLVTKLL
jgi:hypothetical protein